MPAASTSSPLKRGSSREVSWRRGMAAYGGSRSSRAAAAVSAPRVWVAQNAAGAWGPAPPRALPERSRRPPSLCMVC